jgi:Flp pilus assembly pilin Flp
MKKIVLGLRSALTDESGTASVEYSVVAGFASIAVVSAATLLGGRVKGLWDFVEVMFRAL